MSEKQINVSVVYFAMFRELAGRGEETWSGPSETPASRIYDDLRKHYDFPLAFDHVRVAINDEFAPGDPVVNSGDKLVFIPPVSGG